MGKKAIWLEDMPLVANKSSAALRAPVEIWKEIIDLVLFHPVLISADPFYPGCNLHSAFNEWNDVKRLRNCEVQRGLCRLVSRSWKALADSTRWQYFEPHRCQDEAQRVSQTKSARRLYFHPICSSCGRYEGKDATLCTQCPEYVRKSDIMELFSQLDGEATNARVLELPWGVNWRSPSSRVLRGMVNAFPNLNALLTSVEANPIPDILSIVATLTLLSLDVDVNQYGEAPQAVQPAPVFSSLKTFKIQATYESNLAFIEDWDMPVLAHLEVASPSSGLHDPEDEFTIPRLITKFGTNLISLRVRIYDEYVFLPDSVWEDMPILEYMGTTPMDSSVWWPKSPPDGHPLRTLAILDDETQIPSVRLDTFQLTEGWENLTSIADIHSWEETPEDLLDDCKSGITFDHQHRPDPCPLCVGVLYTMCLGRGINYLDRTGRTFAESRGDVLLRPRSLYFR